MSPITRCNFIVWYLGGRLTATVAAIIAPPLVFVYSPAGSKKQSRLTVRLDRPLGQLGEGDALKFASPRDTGFVMRDGGGDNSSGAIAFNGYVVREAGGTLDVFAVNCSHLGCSVKFNAAARRFECPCHGSLFNTSGQVIHGPATYPLSHLSWQESARPDEIRIDGRNLPGVG